MKSLCELINRLDINDMHLIAPFINSHADVIDAIIKVSDDDITIILLRVLHQYCSPIYDLKRLLISLNAISYNISIGEQSTCIDITTASINDSAIESIQTVYPNAIASMSGNRITINAKINDPRSLLKGISILYPLHNEDQ